MSILIKGIDMPKEGESYIVELKPYEAVTFKRGEKIKLMQRQVYEAIQIPTPHGRLIDASKVFTYDHRAEDNLKSVPTILEEEK